MTSGVRYPKRILHDEAFACQYSVIEKTLIEVKNQPSGFFANNKRKTTNYKTPLPTGNTTSSNISLYPDMRANLRDMGSSNPEYSLNSFSKPRGPTQQEPQVTSSNNTYIFDPFKPVDLNKDTVENNRVVFNSPLNLDYTDYSLRRSVPNIWGDSKSQGLSKNASVWA